MRMPNYYSSWLGAPLFAAQCTTFPGSSFLIKLAGRGFFAKEYIWGVVASIELAATNEFFQGYYENFERIGLLSHKN
jgi:uncharacterized protein (DUF2461 family)